MRININDHKYNLDLTNVIALACELYDRLKTTGLETKNGKLVKFHDRSIMRSGLKLIMTPVIIPWLNDLYKDRGIILDPPERHCDLIDYSFNALMDYMLLTQGKLNVNLTSETSEDNSETIKSISSTWEEERLAIGSPENSTENQ